MVVATQNPIEHEGTFPLPEAQLDRFLLHVVIALPAAPVERQILDLVEREIMESETQVSTRLSIAEIQTARDETACVHLAPAIKDYIVRIVTAPRDERLLPDIRRSIAHPPSPRGTISLALAAKARAYIAGRDTVTLEDVTELAADVLAHRIVLSWQAAADGESARGLVERILDRVQPL
jgi:MoxR-like ATPase